MFGDVGGEDVRVGAGRGVSGGVDGNGECDCDACANSITAGIVARPNGNIQHIYTRQTRQTGRCDGLGRWQAD